LGLSGVYQPTVNPDLTQAASIYPAERDPALTLTAWQGDLGLGNGAPQSVYELDARQLALGKLTNQGTHTLRPGETWTLPDTTTVQFVGTKQWVTLAIRHDPGEQVVLFGAGALLVGLMVSLSGKRRRFWARITPSGTGGSLMTLAALARTEYPGLAEEFTSLVSSMDVVDESTGADPVLSER
jgi:cytochrome c biogenesis protein